MKIGARFFEVVSDDYVPAARALWEVAEAHVAEDASQDPAWADARQRRFVTALVAVQMLIAFCKDLDEDVGPIVQALPTALGSFVGQVSPDRAEEIANMAWDAFRYGYEMALQAPTEGQA